MRVHRLTGSLRISDRNGFPGRGISARGVLGLCRRIIPRSSLGIGALRAARCERQYQQSRNKDKQVAFFHVFHPWSIVMNFV
ncbi:hypothetical protein D1872_215850 [compost metagenome]